VNQDFIDNFETPSDFFLISDQQSLHDAAIFRPPDGGSDTNHVRMRGHSVTTTPLGDLRKDTPDLAQQRYVYRLRNIHLHTLGNDGVSGACGARRTSK
jgi:hypothetical protein